MRTRIFWIATLSIIVTVFVGAMTTLHSRQFAADTTVQGVTATVSDQPKQVPRATSASFLEMDGLEFERKVVKGAPFSATLVIETIQSLPNGSSNTSKTVSLIYRDAQGRTRRDRMPSHPREVPIGNTASELTTINDPVTGFFYILEPRAKIARKGTLSSHVDQDSDSGTVIGQSASSDKPAGSSQMLPVPATSEARQKLERSDTSSSVEPKREILGHREIEGLSAEGTRITMSIPAVKTGNGRSVETVVERWYSADLKTVVLIQRSDPRFGSSVLRLTSIQRAAPAARLFNVPSEFKILPR